MSHNLSQTNPINNALFFDKDRATLITKWKLGLFFFRMRLLWCLLALSTMSTPAFAEECAKIVEDASRLACYDSAALASSATNKDTPGEADEACAAIGALASAVHARREDGLSMSSVMSAVTKGQSGSALEIIRELVMDAYDLPQFRTPENVKNQAIEFRNDWESRCYQMFR